MWGVVTQQSRARKKNNRAKKKREEEKSPIDAWCKTPTNWSEKAEKCERN
jgi:hypothetical protein